MMELKAAHRLARKLKKADIVMISEKGLIHVGNKLLQRSRWNHIMLYMGGGFTFEVTPRNGAHVCDFIHDLTEKRYAELKVLRKKNFSQANRISVIKLALRLFKNEKFSLWQYIKIFFGRTLHWKKNGNRSHVCIQGHKCGMANVVCSNMVAIAYYEAGFPISERYMPEYVIPRDYEEAKGLKTVIDRKLRIS